MARYITKVDAVHQRNVGIWDTEADEWLTEVPSDLTGSVEPVVAAGVPFWRAGDAALIVARLNAEEWK